MQLADAMESGATLIQSLNMDQEIVSFLTKMTSGSTTTVDLNEKVLGWIKSEGLERKIKLSFLLGIPEFQVLFISCHRKMKVRGSSAMPESCGNVRLIQAQSLFVIFTQENRSKQRALTWIILSRGHMWRMMSYGI